MVVPDDWGPWTSTCSNDATRTRTAKCMKGIAAEDPSSFQVPHDQCSGLPVALSEGPKSVTSSCTYTAAYGQYGACSAGSQSAPIVSCTRSDGSPAALGDCAKQTDVRTCTMPATNCGEMKSGQWSNGTQSVSGLFSEAAVTLDSKIAEATAGCKAIGQAGVCRFNIEGNGWSFVPNQSVRTGWGGHLYAAACTL